MSNIIPFNFNSQSVRVITDNNGEPWFVLADVCKVLALDNPTKVKGRLNEADIQVIDLQALNTKEGRRIKDLVNTINESGLYDVVLDSRKQEAKEFRRYVTSEILPSIRKTGSYSITQQFPVPQTFSEALKLAYEQSVVIDQQKQQIEEKDQYIVASNEASIKAGEILVREFVKSNDLIQIGQNEFYEWMREQGILLKNCREPDQRYVKRGYFTYKPSEEMHGGKFRYTLRITPRGKIWLARRYLDYLDSDITA